jgi:hypothetical protein
MSLTLVDSEAYGRNHAPSRGLGQPVCSTLGQPMWNGCNPIKEQQYFGPMNVVQTISVGVAEKYMQHIVVPAIVLINSVRGTASSVSSPIKLVTAHELPSAVHVLN